VPSAFARKDEPAPQLALENVGEHGALLGHNSRGVDIDSEQAQEAPPRESSLDIEALVSRAAAIHSDHVAARRKRLTVVALRPQDLTGGQETKSKPDSKSST
jgi:hypothetical protein